MVPTLVEIPNILVYLFVNFFLKTIEYRGRDTALDIITGEPTYTESKQWDYISYPSYINYCLKRRCSVANNVQPVVTGTAVRIDNCLKRTSAIKIATMKIMDNFCYAIMCTTKSTLFVVSKDANGKQRKALVSP